MRILYIITKSEAGGAQTHVFQLSRYISSLGNEVAVMSYPGGCLEQEMGKLGVKFYPNNFFRNSYNLILGLRAMKEVKKAVKDFKPDLVSCHSTMAGFWGRLALRQAQGKPPVIFTAHGWGFTPGAPFWRKIVILAEKMAAHYCDKIICVSKYDKQLALRHKITPAENLVMIHNGVEVTTKRPKNFTRNGREKLKIVFVGRLAKPKEPELLIEAFNELPKALKEKAQVVVVGDGPKRKKLENFIKKNKLEEKIKLLRALPREKVFEVLRKSDIFVLTSKYEGFPRTILEAMSFGLPVIVSNVGGIKEVVNEEIGYLIGRGDKEGLKKALIELIENPKLIEKKGKKARERVEKEFSLEKMLKNTAKIYSQLQSQKEPISKRSNF